jgi:hypothetical protein
MSKLLESLMIFKIKLLTENIAKSWVRRQPRPFICDELKMIYYPVPKAASSTVRRYLIEHGFPGRLSADKLTHKNIQSFVFPRTTLKRAIVIQQEGYRSFAVVRNPYERIVSCYYDKIIGIGSNPGLSAGFVRYNQLLVRQIFRNEMTFTEFIRVVCRIPDFAADAHFRCQRTFLPTKGNRVAMDCVIKMERFNEQFPVFLATEGLPSWESKRENKTERNGGLLREFPETIPLIRKRYASCFRLLDYPPDEVPDV